MFVSGGYDRDIEKRWRRQPKKEKEELEVSEDTFSDEIIEIKKEPRPERNKESEKKIKPKNSRISKEKIRPKNSRISREKIRPKNSRISKERIRKFKQPERKSRYRSTKKRVDKNIEFSDSSIEEDIIILKEIQQKLEKLEKDMNDNKYTIQAQLENILNMLDQQNASLELENVSELELENVSELELENSSESIMSEEEISEKETVSRYPYFYSPEHFCDENMIDCAETIKIQAVLTEINDPVILYLFGTESQDIELEEDISFLFEQIVDDKLMKGYAYGHPINSDELIKIKFSEFILDDTEIDPKNLSLPITLHYVPPEEQSLNNLPVFSATENKESVSNVIPLQTDSNEIPPVLETQKLPGINILLPKLQPISLNIQSEITDQIKG